MSAGTIWQRKHGGTRFGAKLLLENGVTFNRAMYRAAGLACAAAVAAGYWYPRAHPLGKLPPRETTPSAVLFLGSRGESFTITCLPECMSCGTFVRGR